MQLRDHEMKTYLLNDQQQSKPSISDSPKEEVPPTNDSSKGKNNWKQLLKKVKEPGPRTVHENARRLLSMQQVLAELTAVEAKVRCTETSQSSENEEIARKSGIGVIDALQELRSESISRYLTVNLGLAAAWRNDMFNWFDATSMLGCWYCLLSTLIADSITLAGGSTGGFKPGEHDIMVHVITVCFMTVKFLGFLKGTGIQMAT